MDITNPLDIFNEGLLDDWKTSGKERAVDATIVTPEMQIKEILSTIDGRESWDILANILKLYQPEVRTYIYKQSFKEY